MAKPKKLKIKFSELPAESRRLVFFVFFANLALVSGVCTVAVAIGAV